MNGATFACKIDWNKDGDFSDTNEDVTSYLINKVVIDRGRNKPHPLVGRAGPASCSLVLDNRTGIFSPTNSSSPLYGNLEVGRPLQFSFSAPVSKNRFTGTIANLTTSRIGNMPVCLIEGIGPLGSFGERRISPAIQALQTSGAVIGTVLDTAGWSGGARILDTGASTFYRWFITNQYPVLAMRDVEDSELGFVYEDEDGNIVYEDRHHRLIGAHLTSQATYSDAPGATYPYLNPIETPNPLEYIFNIATATVTPFSTLTQAVLWTLTGELPILNAGESRSWNATIRGSRAAGIAAVESWLAPEVGTDLLQSGVDDTDIAISVTPLAQTMRITVTNNGATASQLSLLQARGVPILAGSGTGVQSQDSTSITKYGPRSYPNPGTWMADTNVAQSLVDAIVLLYKNRQQPVYLHFNPGISSALYSELLTRKISDRVTAVGTQSQTALGLSADYFVESIHDEIDIDAGRHEVVMGLSPAPTGLSYWILGTNTLGVNTYPGW